jgi:hypothetical protein
MLARQAGCRGRSYARVRDRSTGGGSSSGTATPVHRRVRRDPRRRRHRGGQDPAAGAAGAAGERVRGAVGRYRVSPGIAAWPRKHRARDDRRSDRRSERGERRGDVVERPGRHAAGGRSARRDGLRQRGSAHDRPRPGGRRQRGRRPDRIIAVATRRSPDISARRRRRTAFSSPTGPAVPSTFGEARRRRIWPCGPGQRATTRPLSPGG